MVQLTLAQSATVVFFGGAAWLMVRAGTTKKRLEIRQRPRCASCGRRLTGVTCSCAR